MCVCVCVLFVYLGHCGEQCASITWTHLGPVSEGYTDTFWLPVSFMCAFGPLCKFESQCGFYVFFCPPGVLFFPRFTSICQFWCDGLSLKGSWWVCVCMCVSILLSYVGVREKLRVPIWHLATSHAAINQQPVLPQLPRLPVPGVSEGNSAIHYLFECDRKKNRIESWIFKG